VQPHRDKVAGFKPNNASFLEQLQSLIDRFINRGGGTNFQIYARDGNGRIEQKTTPVLGYLFFCGSLPAESSNP
jgi:hypothetical protein